VRAGRREARYSFWSSQPLQRAVFLLVAPAVARGQHNLFAARAGGGHLPHRALLAHLPVHGAEEDPRVAVVAPTRGIGELLQPVPLLVGRVQHHLLALAGDQGDPDLVFVPAVGEVVREPVQGLHAYAAEFELGRPKKEGRSKDDGRVPLHRSPRPPGLRLRLTVPELGQDLADAVALPLWQGVTLDEVHLPRCEDDAVVDVGLSEPVRVGHGVGSGCGERVWVEACGFGAGGAGGAKKNGGDCGQSFFFSIRPVLSLAPLPPYLSPFPAAPRLHQGECGTTIPPTWGGGRRSRVGEGAPIAAA